MTYVRFLFSFIQIFFFLSLVWCLMGWVGLTLVHVEPIYLFAGYLVARGVNEVLFADKVRNEVRDVASGG